MPKSNGVRAWIGALLLVISLTSGAVGFAVSARGTAVKAKEDVADHETRLRMLERGQMQMQGDVRVIRQMIESELAKKEGAPL